MANSKKTHKKCKFCGESIRVEDGVQTPRGFFCNPEHAFAWVKKKKEAKFRKDCNSDRKVANENTKSYQMKKAQEAFNKFIRLRDIGLHCISCWTFYINIKKKNAGHYRSVGAAPHLRFNEDNVHLQCECCNTHKSGNAIEYRIELVNRIGIERVEALEADSTPKQYRIEDYKEIRQKYNVKCKELESRLNP